MRCGGAGCESSPGGSAAHKARATPRHATPRGENCEKSRPSADSRQADKHRLLELTIPCPWLVPDTKLYRRKHQTRGPLPDCMHHGVAVWRRGGAELCSGESGKAGGEGRRRGARQHAGSRVRRVAYARPRRRAAAADDTPCETRRVNSIRSSRTALIEKVVRKRHFP